MTTFQTVIAEIANAFEFFNREHDGKRYYRIKETAPSWLTTDSTFMREIHDAIDGRLPDDWIYEHTMRVAQDLESRNLESSDDISDTCEVADSLVDTYTQARLEWLAMHLGNLALCDEAVSEGLVAASASIEDRIGVGQYIALQRICDAVVAAAAAQADERDSTSEDDSPEFKGTDDEAHAMAAAELAARHSRRIQ